jgi:hypothetical protein
MSDIANALHEVVEETQETVRLLTVFHDALRERNKAATNIRVLPARVEVVPAPATSPLQVALAAKG